MVGHLLLIHQEMKRSGAPVAVLVYGKPGKGDKIRQQESPPAWTQEAYRPPRSKCSLCWRGVVPRPISGGVPHLRSGGVTHPRSGGVPHPISGGYPSSGQGGTPSQVWMGGYPIQSWWGVPQVPPLSRPGMGYPPNLSWGTPPPLYLGWGTPQTQDGFPPDLR